MVRSTSTVRSIRYASGVLELLDQRELPARELWLRIDDLEHAARAIRDLVVRGAPAIGLTAAYACVLAARARGNDREGWLRDLDVLAAARPTAINLRGAVEQMRGLAEGAPGEAVETLERAALAMHEADLAANDTMAGSGASLIEPGSTVLTHCNTGALATGGIGTALGVIVRAWNDGRLARVLACETRPWLQGLRLTAWELAHEGVPVEVLVEGAAAAVMQRDGVDWVIVGADRICANGDVANKVGTLMLAVLARRFGARFMVVAPSTTLDPSTPSGDRIEIEQRDGGELWRAAGLAGAPAGVATLNPVFDLTPAELIDCIVTERGVLEPPFGGRIRAAVDEP
ncbi:S-methyl-5-thioribose-1-phosphate isomerase [Wenzhouxiangella sp. XN79A]|uniref:S-methyl-5-thioribose-1-phosphate isomerase n=1 Tax=Wenzhouxiangella sp. XN79A TaxID=2724193 RepID=UPI00144AD3BA|nr:S-methyl-5-thioribose-1-phosphate isomerase [Wenzhouxiangella sp. XN79A]NKI33711.1 S-methyl-5-thioribose-1-phosphate isomerase [Wenzhouxiangella sp. XN79A]